MGPISCDGSYGSYGIDHDGANRFDGIDFDNGAKPVGTASFGLDLRCGLLPNECPNEDRPVRISPFSVLRFTFDLRALGVLCVRHLPHAEDAEGVEAMDSRGLSPRGCESWGLSPKEIGLRLRRRGLKMEILVPGIAARSENARYRRNADGSAQIISIRMD